MFVIQKQAQTPVWRVCLGEGVTGFQELPNDYLRSPV